MRVWKSTRHGPVSLCIALLCLVVARVTRMQGLVPATEPFQRLVTQGMVLGRTVKVCAFCACNGSSLCHVYVPCVRRVRCLVCYVYVSQCACVTGARSVIFRVPARVFRVVVSVPLLSVVCVRSRLPSQDAKSGRYLFGDEAAQRMSSGGAEVKWEKMSKSKGNGVEPSHIVREVGVDATRLNVLFKVCERGVCTAPAPHLPRRVVVVHRRHASSVCTPGLVAGTACERVGVGRGQPAGPDAVATASRHARRSA